MVNKGLEWECMIGGCQEGIWLPADLPEAPVHLVKYCMRCGRLLAESVSSESLAEKDVTQ